MKKKFSTFIQLGTLTTSLMTLIIQSGCGSAAQNSNEDTSSKELKLSSGQAATSFVLGQPDFTSRINSTASETTVSNPTGVHVASNGALYVVDQGNSRILGYTTFPSSMNPPADFVIGKPDFTTATSGSASDLTALVGVEKISSGDGKLFVGNSHFHRVQVFPLGMTTAPSALFSIGATGPGNVGSATCVASRLSSVSGIAFGDGKLVLSDEDFNRVMIFNSAPTTNNISANIVLGQTTLTSCSAPSAGATTASTLSAPRGVWTDGTKLAIADTAANRVLLWDTFPTSDGQPADHVLGQPDFTSNTANNGGISAKSLDGPSAVAYNGSQLFIADTNNSRVLAWSSWPDTDHKAAAVVLGQPHFTTNAVVNPPTAHSLNEPRDVTFNDTSVVVSDTSNQRTMIFVTH
jgi:hypothetical protein